MISQPMLPRGPSCRASSETEPPRSSLLPSPIQFPFSPKDALNGEPASSFCALTRAKEQARTAAQTDLPQPLEASMGEMRCDATCLVP